MKNHKIESCIGERISNVLQKAKRLSIELNKDVEFDFNGVRCVVNGSTFDEYFLRDYDNALLLRWKTIGPFCQPLYSLETIEAIKQTKEKQEYERLRYEAEYQAKQAKRLSDYEAETAGIKMDYVDKSAFDDWHSKNQDGYGNAVFVYAMQWAKLMQARMKDGLTVKDVAKKASHDADTVGLSGAQYGMAVSLLKQTWGNGKELEVWHRLPYDKQ